MKSKHVIKLSYSAKTKLTDIAKSYDVNNILFYIKGGGCNGFNYTFEPMKEIPQKSQELVQCNDGIHLVVCNNSLFHVLGTTVDWKKNIMGESFHFYNPNAVSECGCGTSFSIS